MEQQAQLEPNTAVTDSSPSEDQAGSGLPTLDEAIASAERQMESTPELTEQPNLDAEKEAQTAAEDDSSPTDGQPGSESKEDSPPSLQAPEHWPAERRAAFDALPDEHKAILGDMAKDMESGWTKKSQELSDNAKFGETIKQAFNDFDRQHFQSLNLDEAQAVQQLVGLNRLFASQPQTFAEHIIPQLQKMGVDFSKIIEGQSHEPENKEWVDPELEELKSKINGLETTLTEKQQYEQDQANKYIQTTIETFKSQTNEDGSAKYPMFDQVAHKMGELMNDPRFANRPTDTVLLDELYKEASAPLTDQIQAEAKRQAEALAKAEQAERAKKAATIKGDGTTAQQNTQTMSLDDIINKNATTLGVY